MSDNVKKSLIEAYITAAEKTMAPESAPDTRMNKKVRKITEVILENQINQFCEVSKKSESALFEQILGKNGIMNEDTAPTASVADADIAKFAEIYLPIAAKVIPSLVINNMVGVQPMTQPNGYVYAMRSFYTRSPYATLQDARGMTYSKTQILNVASATSIAVGSGNCWIANAAGAVGYVVYKEGTLLLVKVADADTLFAAADAITIGSSSSTTYSTADTTVSAIYLNEIAQAAGIFKYYSGYTNAGTAEGSAAFSTDQGEYAQNVGEIQIRVEREAVEAKTRQLFAEYPIEAEQDLRAIHKRDLRAELSEITAGEIVNEINKEFIDNIKTAAQIGGTTTFDMESADGRWEIEKYRSLWVRVSRGANQIAQATRLGPGNYIIASPDVCTALSQLDGFCAAPPKGTFGNISPIGGDWYVGRIGGTMDLYRDMFATTDYISVGRKGANEWDAGLFFLPYIPLQFIAGQSTENLQPKLKFMTRYGKVANVLRASSSQVADARYYRYINVSNLFTNL